MNVPIVLTEELDNRIRVIQRRCNGTRDVDHLLLRIITSTLPPFLCRGTPPLEVPWCRLSFRALREREQADIVGWIDAKAEIAL